MSDSNGPGSRNADYLDNFTETFDASVVAQQHQGTSTIDFDEQANVLLGHFEDDLAPYDDQELARFQEQTYPSNTGEDPLGTELNGLSYYVPPPAHDSTQQPYRSIAASVQAQLDVVTESGSSVARDHPSLLHSISDPTNYQSNGYYNNEEPSRLIRHHQSMQYLAEGSHTQSEPPSAGAMHYQQPSLYMQGTEPWPQPYQEQGAVITLSPAGPYIGNGSHWAALQERISSSQTPASDQLATPRPKKKPASRKQRGTPVTVPRGGRNPTCINCEKPFKPTEENKGERCNRCLKTYQKTLAGPSMYFLDPTIPTFNSAYDRVYPKIPPLDYEGNGQDDVHAYVNAEDEWVTRFIAAANVEYREYVDVPADVQTGNDEDDHLHYLKQQLAYNKKPHHDSSKDLYTNEWVTIQMRMLFRAVLTYHCGGPPVYPIGGNNRGYGETKDMRCSERLVAIEMILRINKRVVMDVVDGRGVDAFARNPWKYGLRKTQNNGSNETKTKQIKKAKELEAADPDFEDAGPSDTERGVSLTPARGRSKRKAGPQGGRSRNNMHRSITRALTEQPGDAKAPVANMMPLTSGDIYTGPRQEARAAASTTQADGAFADGTMAPSLENLKHGMRTQMLRPLELKETR